MKHAKGEGIKGGHQRRFAGPLWGRCRCIYTSSVSNLTRPRQGKRTTKKKGKGAGKHSNAQNNKPATCPHNRMKVMLKIRVRGQNRGLSVGTVEREGYEGVWSKVKVELRSLRSVRSKVVCGGIYK